MTKEEALSKFEDWYEACLENGILPEEIVYQMGGMALITDDELVDELQDDGRISSF